jgi:hypothetical protein
LGRLNPHDNFLTKCIRSDGDQPMVICSFRQVSIFFKTFLPWKPFRNEFAKPCPWTTIATPGSLDLHAETHYFSCSFPSTLDFWPNFEACTALWHKLLPDVGDWVVVLADPPWSGP